MAATAPDVQTTTGSDIHSAEHVAHNYLKFNFSEDYQNAVQFIAPESLRAAKAYVIAIIKPAIQQNQLQYVEATGIHNSVEELEQLSPEDFYIKVFGIIQMPKGDHEQLKLATFNMVGSKLLADDTSAVSFAINTPSGAPPYQMRLKLALINGQWKVCIGQ